MKTPQKPDTMEVDKEDEEAPLTLPETSSDLCQTLMERYAKSKAPQHHHLCASAAAMRAILQEESLPLTPPAYFAATISAINNASESLDPDSISALSSFLSILLPLVPSQSLPPDKAIDAVLVLVGLLGRLDGAGSASAVRSVIKSIGILMRFCEVEDWGVVKGPFEMILRFSVDKRPKVRRCAQTCLEEVFKSFHSYVDIKEASKVVFTLFKSYMPREIESDASRVADESKSRALLKPEHAEVVHMLNSLKIVVPYLSKNVSLKLLSCLYRLVTCHFSPITRHLFDVLQVFFESSRADVIVPEAENIITLLVSYVSTGLKNPTDTLISASILLKSLLSKLQAGVPNISMTNLPAVFRSIAGLLVLEPIASQIAAILKALICKHIDTNAVLVSGNEVDGEKIIHVAGAGDIESICAAFENILSSFKGVPNEHTLVVISNLFLNLGELSYRFMKGILLKLTASMMLENIDITARKHLEECIGSAVIAMGPERILTLVPVSLHPEKLTCSNIWLVPILKKNIVGASLKYFMDHVLPLFEALQRASRKAKKASLRKELKACTHEIWDLLPAFCRYPLDTYKNFQPLAHIFMVFLKEDNDMHKNIALAFQELVNQNRSILGSTQTAKRSVKQSAKGTIEETKESRSVPANYSRKFAMKNIKALSSCSSDLLQALVDLFFISSREKRAYLKEAIESLGSITESSEVKRIFSKSLEEFNFVNEVGMSEKLETSSDKDLEGNTKNEVQDEQKRCLIMEFASSIVEGADEDLVNTIFHYVMSALQVTVAIGQPEAYYTLSRIFQQHACFCSSHLDEIMALLLSVKSRANVMSLRSRFACFHTLLVYLLKSDLEERNAKAFLILNEIILALKDSNEESRKAAYDILLDISDSLMGSPSGSSDSSHQQLCNMLMGYFSGAPPSIMSGAVAALSLLIYKNSDLCFSVPELVPSVLALLQSKAKEVIKAVLGFLKVLVSCLQTSDLHKLLPDIINGILPWSSISRNHFRSKVTVIVEIIIRKCGSSSVASFVPDKYWGFIKNVVEQRHGKTHSKELAASETVQTLKMPSSKGDIKLTHEGTDSGSSGVIQREVSNKRKFGTSSTYKHHESTGTSSCSQKERRSNNSNSSISDGKSGISIKQVERKEGRRPLDGGKKKIGHRELNKKVKAAVHKPASNSKLHKHKTAAGRPRGTKK